MKKLSRCLILVFLAIILFAMPVMAEGSSIKVFINGKVLYDVIPILENGRTLVPISSISEELGVNVNYLEESKKVSIKSDTINMEIPIGSTKAKVDGKEVELDVIPFIKDENIFVPIGFIAKNLGEEVIWDGKNEIVSVGKFGGEAKIEDTFLYYNDEHKYTLNFPNSWKEETIIKTIDGTLYVYDKKSANRFKADGVENFGPVFEIRCSDYPTVATLPYDGDYVLNYEDGKYIEVIFGRDFQFYPETVDSYKKIFNEGQETIQSFRKIDKDSFVEDNKDNYKKEIEVLYDILDNFVSEDIFDRDEVFTYKKPISNTSFLYMRVMNNEEEVRIKIESDFDSNGRLTRYHLKSYGYDFKENKLNQPEALKLANNFIKKYIDENVEATKIPDLYPSLYEKNKHETYGDKDGNYIIVIDLEHGFVEYFSKINIEEVYSNKIYSKTSSYIEDESRNTFSPYYELLDFEITNYQEEIMNERIEAIFNYRIIYKNYDKDPDTVGYIKDAKEKDNHNYQQMYDEYLEPKEMNFELKVVIDENDIIKLYSNISPVGVEWEETKMSDFIINK